MPAMAREMLGRFGAKSLPRFSPLKPGPPRHLLSRPSLTIVSLRIPTTTLSLLCSCSAMAANEVQEPLPKVPKLSENGVHKLNGEGPQQPSLLSLLRVKKLSQNAVLPSRASTLAAGYDLSSAVETKVPARGKALVPTDLSIAIPEGTCARIAPRSGLAWKHSIDVGAGVIDADYRGPVGVVLFNHSDADFEVKPGDRIAQLIIERIVTPEVAEVDDLDDTVRGAGGFGSTGV